MIPTSEQLEEISRLSEGTLAAVPFANLLLALSLERRTLVVEVRRKQIAKRIVIENGVPIDCRSNLVHETLGRYMVAEGKIRDEDLHSYLGQSASRGMPLGEVLLEHDVITAEELYRLLQQNLAKKLLDLFTWRDGELRTHGDVPHLESPLKIRVPQLIVTGITKFAPQEEVDAAVVPLIGKKLCLHPNPPFAIEDIRLNSRQSQVAVALRSGWRIDELALGTGMPFEEITRLLYALAVLGVVITADHAAAAAARSPLRAVKRDAAAPTAMPGTPAGAATAAAAATPAATTAAPSAAAAASPAPAPPVAAAATPGAATAPPGTAAATPGAAVAPSGAAAAPSGAAAAPARTGPRQAPAPPPTASSPAIHAAADGGAASTPIAPAVAAAPASASAASTSGARRTPLLGRDALAGVSATRPMPLMTPPAEPPPSLAPPQAPPPEPAGLPEPTALPPPAAPPRPAAAAVAPERHTTPLLEVPTLPPERRRNEIMQAYLSYRRLDAFDLLGADEEASPAAVEGHYLRFARRFAPWTVHGPEMAGMEEKAHDLFLAGARAYSELLDLEQRNALLFRRRARREERDRRSQADMAIKTDLLDPEVQYRKARALLEAGKLNEAALLLEFASDCDPQNGLYSAELAYCRFCIAPSYGAKAVKELQETLRRDPDCGLAVYYSGEIHRQLGNRDEAEKLLRRAIKMMAPDRRPIDALKALSAEKRR